jgi:preprotein translocase subunit SecF
MSSLSRRERRLLRRFGAKHDDSSPGENSVKDAASDAADSSVEVKKVAHDARHHVDRSGFSGRLLDIYDHHYKHLMMFSFGLLLLCIIIIGVHWASTGNFIEKGISLSGGSTLTVLTDSPVDVAVLKADLRKQFPEQDITVLALSKAGKQLGIIVETTSVDDAHVSELSAKLKSDFGVKTVNVETIGPSLGASFFKEAIYAVLLAFLFMAVVVFIYFRTPMPSSYVVLAAFSDIMFAWAMVILLDVKLSTAGVAAFLMLTGYSVDTDILLTSRVLKREGPVFTKIVDAFSTGIIMTLAAMAATGIAYLTTPSETLKQIMLILFWGLVADIIFTWFQNAGLLRWYLESKEKKDKKSHAQKSGAVASNTGV